MQYLSVFKFNDHFYCQVILISDANAKQYFRLNAREEKVRRNERREREVEKE